MKEVTRTFYIAEDGEEFITRRQCEKYEKENKVKIEMKKHAQAIQEYCESNRHICRTANGGYICDYCSCPFWDDCTDTYCSLHQFPTDWEV